jgi:hypothetical protein
MRGSHGQKRLQAIGLVGGGLLSAATIALYATGRTREAAALAITGSLLAAVFGVARIFSAGYEITISDDPRPGV